MYGYLSFRKCNHVFIFHHHFFCMRSFFSFNKGNTNFWLYMYQLAFVSKEGVFSLTLVFFQFFVLSDILSEVLQHCLFKKTGQGIWKCAFLSFEKLVKKCRFFLLWCADIAHTIGFSMANLKKFSLNSEVT